MSTRKNPNQETVATDSLLTDSDLSATGQDTGYLGSLLKGRYLIEKRLGRGGVGVVYLARDTQLMSKPVVIKVLLEELDGTEHHAWFKRKFQQEIEALSRIDHPGVVGVLDAGEMPDGRPWLVTQYVEGGSLRSVMQPGGMPLARVAEMMKQISHALEAAHEKGVFHRDIKPENIMIQRLAQGEELMKLIDFGIATVRDSQLAANRDKTQAAGTLPYMSPEQLRGRPTAASDIYALGTVAFEMLTGQTPFNPDSPVHLAELQRAGIPVKPLTLRPDLPPAAQDVILKALSYQPEKRYQRARQFGDELARALTGTGSGKVGGEVNREAETKAENLPAGRLTQEETSASSAMEEEPDLNVSPTVEIAHTLCIRIMRYSALPLDQQTRSLHRLQEIVRHTREYRHAQPENQLVSLPTSDGLALVFFRAPVASVRCALEIASAAKEPPPLKLRMGIHSGPVYRISDINAHRNVTGGGITVAQQVMEFGDEGHILLSGTVADVLSQLTSWAPSLHDLGEQEVQPGVRVHLHNLYTDQLGNPNPPERLPTVSSFATQLIDSSTVEVSPKRSSVAMIVGMIAGAALLLVALALFIRFWPSAKPVVIPSPQIFPAPGTNAASPERALTYWLVVEKYSSGKLEQPRRLAHEVYFGARDEFRLGLASAQSGYLYLIGEGPEKVDGLPRYNVLFPNPQSNGGSSRLDENQPLVIPERANLRFDNQKGTETIWLIWSAQAVPSLEAVKTLVNPRDKGAITDQAQLKAIESLLKAQPPGKADTDQEKKQTKVSGKGELLVHHIRLEHG